MIAETSLPLALTMGDPAGIGPEIALRAWMARDRHALPAFFLLARKSLYEGLATRLGLDVPVATIRSPDEAPALFAHALPVLQLPEDVTAEPGKPSSAHAAMTIRSIAEAFELVRRNEAAALVTNPINKSVLYQAGFGFPGHTEFLAELAGKAEGGPLRPVMMLAGPDLRTVPLTIHEPLRRVPDLVDQTLIVDTIRIVCRDMARFFGLPAARVAVCGLNPHAGESGAIGSEEVEIIGPAIARLRAEGIDAFGPLPADTMFHAAARKNYDVAIGMYHDQALIPLKMLAFDQGVNITLGLPFVRTSPDHGTAYDIAGKGVASPSSLIEALKTAQNMAAMARSASA
jgi:4-hydroxythreonine-4-phosphate dehydrogenase